MAETKVQGSGGKVAEDVNMNVGKTGKASGETTADFLGRVGGTMMEGCKSLGIAFGVETGLFKALVDLHPVPKTSQEIADAAGLKER